MAVPALFLAEALAQRPSDPRLARHLGAALRDRAFLASLATAILYLGFRHVTLPIASGGEGMLGPVPRAEKLLLFLETTGAAAIATVTPWKAELLRHPIAFVGAGRLVAIPRLAWIGALTWLGATAIFARFPRSRAPLTIALGAFLPVSNLVPMGLEARLSDRFLYLPSIGVALALALGICALETRSFRAAAVAVVLGASLFLGLRSSARSSIFHSTDTLFSWEVRNGDRALGVYDNAAAAAANARRYRDARDLDLAYVDRFEQLGFKGEGFAQLVEAVRNQAWATEAAHPPSQAGFERLARALLGGRHGVVDVELEGGERFGLPTSTPEAVAYTTKQRPRLEASLGRSLARRGEPEEGLAFAKRGVEHCPRCATVLVLAAETALAAREPGQATRWLDALPFQTTRAEELRQVALAQDELAASRSAHASALAWFAGGDFRDACSDTAGGSLAAQDKALVFVLAAACRLAVDEARLALLVTDPEVAARVDSASAELRHDDVARAKLALQAARVATR